MESNNNSAWPGDNGTPFLNIPPILAPKTRDDGVLSQDFVCAVCCELPASAQEAVVTPCCHHVFCTKCMTAAIQTAGVCPLDRKSLSMVGRTNRPVLIDGLPKRVFESIPVVCPRDGCSWEGLLSGYRSHAEDCAVSASVSETSKLDLAKKLQKADIQLDCARKWYRKLKGSLDGVIESLEESTKESDYISREYKNFKRRHNHFKKLVGDDMDKLEKKVSELEKEKAELLTKLSALQNDWSNRLRKRGRS